MGKGRKKKGLSSMLDENKQQFTSEGKGNRTGCCVSPPPRPVIEPHPHPWTPTKITLYGESLQVRPRDPGVGSRSDQRYLYPVTPRALQP